jgi:hypothetical protein
VSLPFHHKRTTCRVCGSDRLASYLSLGPTPLANSFLRSPEEFHDEPFYPLDVYFCASCSLVQLLDVIDPAVLFRNYIYVTGTSETMARHNAEYARTVIDLLRLGPADLVIEVASNDGSLLKCFKHCGVRTLGVEPAANIAEIACASGIDTIPQFFNSCTAQQVRELHGPAKVIIGNNVLAHVDDTQDFLSGCKELLDSSGLVVIEVPYLRDLLDRLEYDTIYHEHLCYFSVTTLLRLCDVVGLCIFRVDHVPVHGGSLRMYAGSKSYYKAHSRKVLALADEETSVGLTEFSRYERFAEEVKSNRKAIEDLLLPLKSHNHTLAAYGAPAKGNTLLNYCGIGTDLVPCTFDKNSMKVGLYTPGMHIPVLPVADLLDRFPDYLLILAWNFADEIIEQQQEYAKQGGRFIIPIPQPRIV